MIVRTTKQDFIALDDVVEYQITKYPDSTWTIFVFTNDEKMRQLAVEFDNQFQAIEWIQEQLCVNN